MADPVHTHPLRLCVRRTPVPGELHRVDEVTLRVPSELDCVEEAVSVLTRHCLAGAEVPARQRFRLQVALSDALANAIVSGNRENSSKYVHVKLDLAPEAISIHVTDEGEGFDHEAAMGTPVPAPADAFCGRGLFLIRHLVDDVRFNAQGNSICMTLRRP